MNIYVVNPVSSCGLGVEFIMEKDKDGLALPGDDRVLRFKVSTLAYADDLIIIAEDPDNLTQALSQIRAVGEPLGVRINVSKTKVQWLSKGSGANVSKIVKLGNDTIDTVKSFTYLGSLFTELQRGGVVRPDILANVKSARLVLDSLTNIFALKGLGIRTKERLVKSLVLPKLYYGAEAWACSEVDLAPMEALLSRARRLIMQRGNLGASTWRLKTYDLAKSRVLTCSARQTVARRRLAFATQLAAGGACTISRNLLSSRVSIDAGRRIGGRCRNHYLRALVADYQWLTGSRDPQALSELIGEAADYYMELISQAKAAVCPKNYPIDHVYRSWQRTMNASTLAKYTKRKLRRTQRLSQLNRKGVTPSLVGLRPQTTQVRYSCSTCNFY